VVDTQTLRYSVVAGWEQLPSGITHLDCVGVDVDGDDNVYLLTRDENQVLVYRPDGSFVRAWGKGMFEGGRPHGLRFGPDGNLYLVDDNGHCVYVTTPAGDLIRTIGTRGQPAETGYAGSLESIKGGPPFNAPTNLAFGPTGDIYVTDGYRNARVHRFSPTGELIKSWGGPGTGPGQFNLPHGIAVTKDGRVLVADRENDRVQLFDLDGTYLATWSDILRPTNLDVDASGRIYVSELWRPVGDASYVDGPTTADKPGRISVFDNGGTLLARFGGSSEKRSEPGYFVAPHDVCVDSRGDLYVAEVTKTFGWPRGVPENTHSFQKLARAK
jgi:DNA-binding beta-propeller fold protein YncE